MELSPIANRGCVPRSTKRGRSPNRDITSAVSDPGTVVDTIDGHLCLSTGRDQKQTGLALCFDGRHTRGDVLFGSPIQTSAAATTYFGLTIGFGFAQSKPK